MTTAAVISRADAKTRGLPKYFTGKNFSKGTRDPIVFMQSNGMLL